MKVIAGCIIRDETGKYLLVQEKQEKAYGLWNIPAGYAEDGENPRQTAVRETLEEVGLTVMAQDEAIFQLTNTQKGKQYYAFVAWIVGDETLTLQRTEILDAQWLTFEEIKKLQADNKIRERWIWTALSTAEYENSRD